MSKKISALNIHDLNLIGKNGSKPSGVSIDSRSIDAGDIFIAIKGKNHDGHAFVQAAKDKGASLAIVETLQPIDIKQIVVEDTTFALFDLAIDYLKQHSVITIAITGSAGKTSTKFMLSHLLESQGHVLVAPLSYNNRIGVALTLLQLKHHHDFLVLEFGTSLPGEIDYLTRSIQPHRRLLLGAFEAHLDGLGSLEGVVMEKGAILDHMKPEQKAMINFDSPFYKQWVSRAPKMQSLPYSPNPGAGKISLRRINPTFIEVETEGTRSEYEFQLLGSHQMSNLSAALECIRSLDLDLSLSMKRIPTLKPVDHRLCPLKTKQGMMIIDDSYNANMGSWKVALDVLKTFDKAKKMIIMSDTEGMGDKAVTNHEQIMHWISSVDNCQLIAIGDLSQMLARQYYHGPLVLCKRAEVISHLSQSNNPDTVVLVKASRSSRLDLLIDEVLLSC